MKDDLSPGSMPVVDISEAKEMLQKARRALDHGKIITAENYAKLAKEVGLNSIAKHESAIEKLVQIRRVIMRTAKNGVDISKAQEYYNQAFNSLEEASYEDVRSYCRMAYLACQPEPEPGKDFIMKTNLHRVQAENGEIQYHYDVIIENQTNIPIERLIITIPEEIAFIFTPRETSEVLRIQENGIQGTTFILDPIEGLEEMNEIVICRDFRVKTVLGNNGDNLVYDVKIFNVSEYIIPAVLISPPAMNGYSSKPGEIKLEDIHPQEEGSAIFELLKVDTLSTVHEERSVDLISIDWEESGETPIERKEWDVEKLAGAMANYERKDELVEIEEMVEMVEEEMEKKMIGEELAVFKKIGPVFTPLPPDPESLDYLETSSVSLTFENGTSDKGDDISAQDIKEEEDSEISWNKLEIMEEELESLLRENERYSSKDIFDNKPKEEIE